ncbi:MAG: cephalosporin hydroxylase family protein [Planctomycetes bacterium]|nr:cephalosporin hydroxylase family protein [Planctomycetota bacterium]
MSEPTKSRWRPYVAILTLVVLSGVGGFYLARMPIFLNPKIQSDAQDAHFEFVNTWDGVQILQYPNDLVLYQEIIAEQEPEWIIETGTHAGGLTLYLSGVLQSIKPDAKILTVDIDPTRWNRTTKETIKNPNVRALLDRVEFIEGGSTAPEVIEKMKQRIGTSKKVLVILDSLHTKEHVMSEMKHYGEMVPPGCYMIVTDTHLDSLWGEVGPKAALDAFLPGHPEFVADRSRERFVVSANFGGWLRKK